MKIKRIRGRYLRADGPASHRGLCVFIDPDGLKTSPSPPSACKLLSVSLIVAVWTFLCVAPLAFALINTEALTRSRGPDRERRGLASVILLSAHRDPEPSDPSVHSLYVVFMQHLSSLPRLLQIYFLLLGFQPTRPSSLTVSHVFVSHQYIALRGA